MAASEMVGDTPALHRHSSAIQHRAKPLGIGTMLDCLANKDFNIRRLSFQTNNPAI